MSKVYYALKFKDGDFIGLGWDGRMEESVIDKKDLSLWHLQEFLYESKSEAEESLMDIKRWYEEDWDNIKGDYSGMWSEELTKEEVEGISVVKIELTFDYKVIE